MNETAQVLPFWGAQTSYLNFCEEDYVVTRYIAEFINTLSSLTYVAYGVYGLSVSGLGSKNGSTSRIMSYLGLVGVGICSAGYHMTLKYHTQMSDELSMHLLTTPLLHRILTFDASPRTTRLAGLFFLAIFTATMVAHMVLDEFLIHAVTFGVGVYLIATRALVVIRNQVADPEIRKNLQSLALFGVFSFAFGYFVWLVDDWACRTLTNMRHSVGLPLAFFFELHGWWHIFTAVGGYIGVAVIDVITSGNVHVDPTYAIALPIPFARSFLSKPKSLKMQ
ncbi:Alkaline ceramidase [Escovopsis weberi]|uniref:Alkaline ceramidase n=1 Tax=Escovopsis weberi TaxID=150374 RepID=A0A0M9VW79_ESCWE|nr:Alkaline ceramidase [Escovopsis weberi]